jgi:predicted ferric reductase
MSTTSVPSFRNRVHEMFRIIHFGCSTSICVLLWLHISTTNHTALIQASLGLCVWTATYTHRNVLLLYRNFARGKPRTNVSVENIYNNLKVNVRVPRPWKVRPGQYVYLTTARSGFFSIFQRHPFMVAPSVKHDFEMRIHPAAGFTGQLLRTCQGEDTHLSAFIEGPYGHGFDLQDFGTVVLFATGMGICGHLPYIQQLVQDHRLSKTKTRDLLFVWSVENKAQYDLVSEIMTYILRKDDLPTALDPSVPSNMDDDDDSKLNRHLGIYTIPDRPGRRPAPHGENASRMLPSPYLIRS